MKILFIPHVPTLNVINRVYEFTKNTDSYFLYWEIDNSSLKNKIISQIKSLKFSRRNKIVQIPLLFKPECLIPKLNTYFLNNLIDKLNIDVVINANALLFDIRSIKVPVYYDMVDDHLVVNLDIGLNERRIKKIKDDVKSSKGVICVTSSVEEKVKKINHNTITVENGVYLDRFQQAKNLKKELGLEEKKVFGYIGGVEEWTGIDKACEAYMKIKDNTNAMIVVGDSQSSFFQKLQEKYKKDILFIGSVPPEKVGDYFKTLDVGLIPFVLNDFTHNAFPIKALEYGLAGVQVISTPLQGLMKKEMPFIDFCVIEMCDKAMKEIDKKEFEFNFDHYDWRMQGQKLLSFIGDENNG